MLDPAGAIGATSLRTIVLHCGLHRLVGIGLRAGWATAPLVIATARAREELAHATHAELGVLLVDPGVRYSSSCAQDAAAFLTMSRSSLKRTLSCRRRFNAS